MSDENVRREAERELGDRPGVVAVALGYKVRGGEMTDVPALRIYVEEKKPAADLAPADLVPPEFGGMPTDVLEPPRVVEDIDDTPCADRQQHGTLTGGITISTLKRAPDGKVELGTLGFMATITGATPPHDIALVTNQHVIVGMAGGHEGDTIYQPKWGQPAADGSVPLEALGADTVGRVLRLPDKKDDTNGSYVDAASVKLAICISSWCNSNCGVSFDKEIQGLAIGGRNDIHDVTNTVAMGEVVVKVGRTTGHTVGTVTGVHVAANNPDGVLVHDNIEVTAVSMQGTANCGGTLRFSDSGDSGAALIDSHRNLIGLHWGHDDTHANISYACYIQPVLDALGVVPITELHPVHGNPAAEGMGNEALAVIEAGPDRRAELRGAFLASPAGRELATEAERHRHEVVHLVNHVRRVTIAWHRNQGPAYLNRLIAHARDPGVPIPHEIEGITRARLLETMADVLSAHGSAELAAAIARRREEALARTADIEDLQQLVDNLARARVT